MEKRECEACNTVRIVVGRGRSSLEAHPCPTCESTCEHCGGSGFIFNENELGYTIATACACKRVTDRIDAFNRALIPARYVDATFQKFLPTNPAQMSARSRAFEFATQFQQGQPGLLFYGACGTGKTHLIIAILRSLIIRSGVKARFVEFFHLLSELRSSYATRRNAAEIIDPLVMVPLLALDELGKGRGSEWEQNILDELLSRRYNAGRTTLFTSNYSPKGEGDLPSLKDRVGERVYSRLQEMCVPHHIPGDDYRRQIAANR